MEQHLIQIRDQQMASWNRFSTGWKKWDGLTMDFLQPMGDEIVRLLQPRGRDVVLDVASGTGEPGLTIATMLNGGKVILTDLSADMLAIARQHAAERGITNIETRVCDCCELPFPDNTFDAICCRFGFMFFPDMLLAAKELARVLKPGGRIAVAVWYKPEKNFWASAIMGTIQRNMKLPPLIPGAPGLFRCADDDLISDLFRQVGLRNVAQKEINGRLNCRTADEYWDMMTEVAAPVVGALSNADNAMKEKIKTEVFQLLKQKHAYGNLTIDSSALAVFAEKPALRLARGRQRENA